MTDFFAEGGWTMYPTMLFGALTVGWSLVLAARPERRFVPLFLALGALTTMTGFLGTLWGLTGLVKASANAAPADVQTIMSACATQALNSLLLGSVLVVVATLGAASGALRVALTPQASVAS
ncbi:MAG: hypothetical protein Q8L48_14435 [Archangium sp.]|nr:hypothetical protein [Archangium sp.]